MNNFQYILCEQNPKGYVRDIRESNVCYTNTRVIINKTTDIFMISGILIPDTYNLDDFDSFKIHSNGMMLFDIPMTLLYRLNPIRKIKDKLLITIPETIYSTCPEYEGISLFLLQFVQLTFEITGKYGSSYSVIQKLIILSRRIRDKVRDDNKSAIEYINSYGNTCKFSNANSCEFYLHQINISGFFLRMNRELTNISLSSNHITLFDYNEYLIPIVSQCIHKYIWTSKHYNALQKSLNKFLPQDMIIIINDYAKTYEDYLYWFSIEPYKNWDHDGYGIELKMGKNFQIKFDNICNGEIYFMGKRKVAMFNGMVEF